MDRRKFVRDVSLYAAGAGAVPVFAMSREALAAETPEPLVGVAAGEDWSALVKKALEPLGGMQAFVKPGQKVFVKPNASFDRTPEQAANTHPKVIKSVVEQCLEADAKEVIVFDRTLAEERRCYMNSGVGPAIEEIGDKRVNLIGSDDRRYVPVEIVGGIAFKNWKFYKDALDADVYVNVPVAKHHKSAGLTLGLKNVLGIIGGNRGKIHWSLDQGIVDLNKVARPKLTIVDATRILLRNGPSGGDLDDVEVKNTVAASGDTVAVDAWIAKNMFGKDPSDIGYIKIAKKEGMGEMDLARIKVVKA